MNGDQSASCTTTQAPTRYQRWSGVLSRGRWTWLAIVATGVRLAYRRAYMPAFLLTSILLVVFNCVLFYVIAMLESVVGTEEGSAAIEFVRALLGVDLRGVVRIGELKPVLWRSAFLFMIRAELLWVLVIVARVGPGLIANDLKTRALPIYFAKPVQPWSYLTGKWMVLATFIAIVMLVPNLLSLVLGTILTGGPGTTGAMVAMGWQLLVSGAGVMVLGGLMMLALSSLCADARLATVGWLALCLLPMAAQSILSETLPADRLTGFLGCISLHRDVLVLCEWLFDLRAAWTATGLEPRAIENALGPAIRPVYPAVVLMCVALVSAFVCYVRVIRFSRSAANV
jgi:hypothetical protein